MATRRSICWKVSVGVVIVVVVWCGGMMCVDRVWWDGMWWEREVEVGYGWFYMGLWG